MHHGNTKHDRKHGGNAGTNTQANNPDNHDENDSSAVNKSGYGSQQNNPSVNNPPTNTNLHGAGQGSNTSVAEGARNFKPAIGKVAWPTSAAQLWDMTKTACTSCTEVATVAFNKLRQNTPDMDEIKNMSFSSDASLIFKRAIKYPSRLSSAVEVAIILLVLAFASWALFYMALAIVGYEVARRLYYAAKVDKTVNENASNQSGAASQVELVGPYSAPRNVFITGASAGIGEQLAYYYAKNGVQRLYLTARSRDRLEAVAKTCKQIAGSRLVVQTMVVDVNNRKLMHSTVVDAHQRTPLDLIIANAGVGISTVDQNASWEDQVRAMTDTNIEGVFNTILPIVPLFKERGRGQIAVISSIAGTCSLPGTYPYAATKAYLNSFGQGLRADLAQYGVSYVNVCPGYVRSRLTEERHNRSKFGLPFFMETEEGARRIAMAIADDIPAYVFPAPMHLAAWLFRATPYSVMDVCYKVGRYLGMNVSSIH